MMDRRVLIIDDETNIRRMMRMTLEADGYLVEDAPDGLKGLELFGDGSRFDAVVLDQKMPNIDGVETLRRMLRRAPSATIIMVTAFGSIELAVEAMKAGARDFLKKPLTPALLRDALVAALSKDSGTPSTAEPSVETRTPAIPAGPQELWTVNGFFIRPLAAVDVGSNNEYRFVVRHAGRGPQGEVLVTISNAEISRIARLSGRPLPPGPAFWQQQAQRALMNYVFKHAALPPDARLAITQIADDVVLLAREWETSVVDK
jgi:DNA-binding response OmpR family regulator